MSGSRSLLRKLNPEPHFAGGKALLNVWGCTVLKHSYFWQQAQIYLSLARYCSDPQLRERHEDLALYFVQTAGREQDLDDAFSYLFGVKKPTPSECT
jgi:hypothetical protein